MSLNALLVAPGSRKGPRLTRVATRVVERVADLVATGGYAEVYDVPGDQLPGLRRQVRTEVRRRTGHGCETLANGGLVVVVCQPVYDQRAAPRRGEGSGRRRRGCPQPADR